MPLSDEQEQRLKKLKEEVGNDELFDEIYQFVMADLAIKGLLSKPKKKNDSEGD